MESQKNVFVGSFKVMSLYCFVQEQGWTLFKPYGHNSFIWEFTEERKLEFASGSVAYEGKLHEHFTQARKK